jgi:hypothetical protein
MSSSRVAIAFYGDYFHSRDQIIEFFAQQGIDDYYDEIITNQLGFDCLNAFSGEGWVMGIGMQLGVPLHLYEAAWAKFFPNSTIKPTAILEVKTY